jgi:hypothetical protein
LFVSLKTVFSLKNVFIALAFPKNPFQIDDSKVSKESKNSNKDWNLDREKQKEC